MPVIITKRVSKGWGHDFKNQFWRGRKYSTDHWPSGIYFCLHRLGHDRFWVWFESCHWFCVTLVDLLTSPDLCVLSWSMRKGKKWVQAHLAPWSSHKSLRSLGHTSFCCSSLPGSWFPRVSAQHWDSTRVWSARSWKVTGPMMTSQSVFWIAHVQASTEVASLQQPHSLSLAVSGFSQMAPLQLELSSSIAFRSPCDYWHLEGVGSLEWGPALWGADRKIILAKWVAAPGAAPPPPIVVASHVSEHNTNMSHSSGSRAGRPGQLPIVPSLSS